MQLSLVIITLAVLFLGCRRVYLWKQDEVSEAASRQYDACKEPLVIVPSLEIDDECIKIEDAYDDCVDADDDDCEVIAVFTSANETAEAPNSWQTQVIRCLTAMTARHDIELENMRRIHWTCGIAFTKAICDSMWIPTERCDDMKRVDLVIASILPPCPSTSLN